MSKNVRLFYFLIQYKTNIGFTSFNLKHYWFYFI